MAALVGVVAIVLSLAQANGVAAVFNAQAFRSDVTLLTHNDLYGNTSTRQAATIVLSARQSQEKSQVGCEALQETLWTLANGTDLDFLRYLDYEKVTDDVGLYWIGNGGAPGCKAITTLGKVQTTACDTRLPALCSHSASLSSPASTDVGPRWQASVNTGKATVLGYRDKLSFRFLGLKYAPRPARFGYSKYQAPSDNISALAYGPGCVQSGCREPSCSEDCLFLNVWTPYLPTKVPSTTKKAVMLWIHGGGFTSGYGSDTTFDGGNMASRGDVVVVTINYRLSTLGHLALDNTTLRGNYWLSDQIAALDWVRAHIEDFGGDKQQVTIFGQSAGAASVRALLASPLAKGKFSRAILQSVPGGVGYAKTFSEYLSISEATALTKSILDETSCAQPDKSLQLACLRALDPVSLVGGRTVARYPVVDGTYLTSKELLLNGSGPTLDVAVMTGVMRDDGDPFSAFSKSSNASQALIEQGYNAAEIIGSNKFPVPNGLNTTLDIFNLTSRVATDAMFRCLTQSTAYSSVSNGVFPAVYSYEIDRGYQISEWSPNPPTCEAPITPGHPYGDPNAPYFHCHSGELYSVFGTIIRQGRQPRDQNDIPFSQYLLDSWTAFGRTKNPNPARDFLRARGFANTSAIVEGTTPWGTVDAGNPKLRALNVKPKDEGFRELEQCAVLGFPLDYYAD
ncbi:cholinesterase [Lentithecium fluviatile CBS 122367]|uniref:Carboxylic ester hydrolase n=1 Tax=Lentithecium fluviatile CBS 122367 TaxID=1168545 RepID=A0A6G1J1T9_9PLEO|nr:cholinesterase [Lentithecium fluviatile CBS 122367]